MHGVLNLLKPPGMTSHDAVAFVRRVLKEKRVGHTGTLDPAAAGVLPICVGQATRLVEYLQAGTKEYIAEATFGFETDTLDAVGQTIREAPAAHIDLEMVHGALGKFLGEIEQTPPLYSAIKKDGQKLYDIARAGGEVEIPKRNVTISQLTATEFTPGNRPKVMLHISCSGGTYIRSLVRDLGAALGSAGTMTFLVRNRSGAYNLADAVSGEEFAASPEQHLVSFESILAHFGYRTAVDDEATAALLQGRIIRTPKSSDEKLPLDESGMAMMGISEKELRRNFIVHDSSKTVFAIAVPSRETGFHRSEKVFDLRVK